MKIKNLTKFYENLEILNISNLEISTNKITALMGHNGSGKSTLLRIIASLDYEFSGEISSFLKKKEISIMLPEPKLLKRSVRANFEFVAKNYGFFNEFKNRVEEALNLVGMHESFLSKNYYELSSGQIQKIAFALVLTTRNKFILLDEPTNSIDLASSKLFAKAVLYMKEKYNCGFLIASHDEKWLSSVCDERIFLYKGRISEFELKNIFEVDNCAINFGKNSEINLDKKFKNSKKIAINQRKIKLSKIKFDDYKKGILHSISMTFNEFALIKIKFGEFLLKVEIDKKEFDILRLVSGDEIYFKIDSSAILNIE